MFEMTPSSGSALPGARWELFRAFSEPLRLRLLALVAEEELTIGELAELLAVAQPNASRHVAQLEAVGLIAVRKQGTRTLARLVDGVSLDAVVADALRSGRGLCVEDGSFGRIAAVVAARDASVRDYFASAAATSLDAPPAELASYVAALAQLLPRRKLAIDVGTGDGGFLDVLAPAFERVVAIDRSPAQITRTAERVRVRGYTNVDVRASEIEDLAADASIGHRRLLGTADAVFAVRLLHHAPRPAELLRAVVSLAQPATKTSEGGAVVVLDYARHEDERMRGQADLWLGFEPAELKRMARTAGLEKATVIPVPSPFRGPDAHLPWVALVGRRKISS